MKNPQINESYLFWLGLLNSSLFWYFIQQTGYVLRGGYFTFKTNYIYPFPVPNIIPEYISSNVERLVKLILEKKQHRKNCDVRLEENEIDKYIYELYELNIQDVEIISDMPLKPMANNFL